MNIVMLGGPGAGKGTASAELSKVFGIPHISTGDIFREAIKNGTELGKMVQDYMNRGVLVPDEIVNAIVKERISEADCDKGVILDGFPRTRMQAIALQEMLNESGKKLDAAIELSIPDEDIVKRITGRRVCSNKECGAIYNIVTRPPKEEGKCDVCGSELVTRKDDNAETVKIRLEEYHKNAEDLITYYKEEKQLKSIYPSIYDENSLAKIIEEVKEYLGK